MCFFLFHSNQCYVHEQILRRKPWLNEWIFFEKNHIAGSCKIIIHVLGILVLLWRHVLGLWPIIALPIFKELCNIFIDF